MVWVIVLPHPCIHKYSMFKMPVEYNVRPMLNTTARERNGDMSFLSHYKIRSILRKEGVRKGFNDFEQKRTRDKGT